MVEINLEEKDSVLIISPVGEIDASSSIHLDNAIKQAIQEKQTKILGDLSGLSYISSAGLGVFISHLEEFKSEGIKMVLCSLNNSVDEVFGILGLKKLIEIKETKEEGLDALNEV